MLYLPHYEQSLTQVLVGTLPPLPMFCTWGAVHFAHLTSTHPS